MARLIQQLKAQSENAELVTDYNGKSVELTIKGNGLIKYMTFEDVADFVGLAEELADLGRTIVNEMNAQPDKYRQ